jgi:hypothetical protein
MLKIIIIIIIFYSFLAYFSPLSQRAGLSTLYVEWIWRIFVNIREENNLETNCHSLFGGTGRRSYAVSEESNEILYTDRDSKWEPREYEFQLLL